MKRIARKKGFTLVEVIVALVILAILAAILIPSLVGWVDSAQQKKCRFELAEIQRDYLAEAAYLAYRVDDAGPLFSSSVKTYGGIYGGAGRAFTCPCGNAGFVVFAPDKSCILQIGCSVHGNTTVTTAEFISALWDTPIYNNQTIADYFSTRKNAGASIDSGGNNWAPGLRAQLAALGIDAAEDTWRIVRTLRTKGYVYWTPEDITTVAVGDTVSCQRVLIDMATGEIVAGTQETGVITIGSKQLDNKETINYLMDDTQKDGKFTPDA